MAQFDVYRAPPGDEGYWLDCQSDLIVDFDTRLIVPLVPDRGDKGLAHKLHPVFDIDGSHIMATQLAAAVPSRLLRQRVRSLAEQRDQIIAALDVLITGF